MLTILFCTPLNKFGVSSVNIQHGAIYLAFHAIKVFTMLDVAVFWLLQPFVVKERNLLKSLHYLDPVHPHLNLVIAVSFCVTNQQP